MKLFSITYDLRQPGNNYSELYDTIKLLAGVGRWQHPLESCWLIKVETNVTVNYVTEQLRHVMNHNDGLFVVDITGCPYQGWLPRSFWNWMKD